MRTLRLLITNTYFTFLVTNPIFSTSDNSLLTRFLRDNHQATPDLAGPFSTRHLEPYVAHHDRPFGNEIETIFMLNDN
jgi:hypothetical protein